MSVTAGGTVDFPNHDRFYHNVFSLSKTRKFDLGLYKNGKSKSVDFATPGVVKIYCNIHPRMVAYVVVVDGEIHGRIDDAGRIELRRVPPGTWTVKIWDEKGGEHEREIAVESNAATELEFELDARSFRVRTHRNKYGEEYPDPDDEESRY